MDDDVAARIGELIARGNVIPAIKELRAATGMGLAEAKALVDAAARGEPLPPLTPRPPADAELPAAVRTAALAGDRIQAIRLLREHTGLGLKDAKDRLDRELPAPPGSRRGCLAPLLLLAALIAAACWR